MGLFTYRLVGAAMLDPAMYEGIEADRGATRQAWGAVLLSALAAGIGASGWHGPSMGGLVSVAAIAVVTWVAWAVLMYQIGARMLPAPETRTNMGELMRTIGFAAAPGILQVFAVFPRVTLPVFVLAWIWMFAATVMAVQHALDYPSLGRALLVCGLAAALSLVVAVGLGLLVTPALS